MRVQVNDEDIAKAIPRDSHSCAVVRAIARRLPDAHRIEVDTQTIRYTDGEGERQMYLTPWPVAQYVVAFDAGDEIKPFAFNLSDPIVARRHEKSENVKEADRQAEAARQRVRSEGGSEVEAKEAGKAAYREVRAKAPAGEPARVLTEGRKATPRAFKTRVRTYGQRQLRINREKNAEPMIVEGNTPAT